MMNLLEKISVSPIIKNIYFEENYFSVFFQKRGNFTPFFEYNIGPYRNDDLLYFNKLPKAVSYINTIFNKFFEKTHDQIDSFFSFHYERYSNKESFLKFLSSELESRILLANHLLQNKIFQNPEANFEIERKMLAKYLYASEWVKNEYRNLKSVRLQSDFIESLKNELQPLLDGLKTRNDTPTTSINDKSLLETIKFTISDTLSGLIQGNLPASILNNTIKKKKIKCDEKVSKVLLHMLIGIKYYSNENGDKPFMSISHNDIAQILIDNFPSFSGRTEGAVVKQISNESSWYNQHKEIKKYIEPFITRIYKSA